MLVPRRNRYRGIKLAVDREQPREIGARRQSLMATKAVTGLGCRIQELAAGLGVVIFAVNPGGHRPLRCCSVWSLPLWHAKLDVAQDQELFVGLFADGAGWVHICWICTRIWRRIDGNHSRLTGQQIVLGRAMQMRVKPIESGRETLPSGTPNP